jgi:hypothetical protein
MRAASAGHLPPRRYRTPEDAEGKRAGQEGTPIVLQAAGAELLAIHPHQPGLTVEGAEEGLVTPRLLGVGMCRRRVVPRLAMGLGESRKADRGEDHRPAKPRGDGLDRLHDGSGGKVIGPRFVLPQPDAIELVPRRPARRTQSY